MTLFTQLYALATIGSLVSLVVSAHYKDIRHTRGEGVALMVAVGLVIVSAVALFLEMVRR